MIRECCQSIDALLQENIQLRRELAEANSVLHAIKHGEVDALLISDTLGDQVFILKGTDHIYRVLVEEMQEGCAAIAANGVILFCNKNLADIIRTPLELVIGSSIYDLLKANDKESFACFLSAGKGSYRAECNLKAGARFNAPVIMSASNIIIDGEPVTCLVVTDLTEQRRSNRFAQMIFNQVKEPIIACDRRGNILQANPAAVTMVGRQLLSKHFDSVIPLFRECDGASFGLYQAIDSKSAYGTEVMFERQDGKVLHLLIHAGRLDVASDDCIIGYVVTLTDITDKCLLSDEMSRFERLNLIGEMAAGIGHEVRNPMTTVRGYLQMFQLKEKYADEHERFQVMIEELDRANSIITEFLSLAKNKRVELKPGNLNGTIHALFPLLQADAFHRGHEIQADIGDIPAFCYDDEEIRQLVLNLVRNGMEAMTSGGLLTIKTYVDNDEIVLAVQDTGTGIPEQVMKRLGTPFVTTKEGGTGLGLSVCYRIAERHNAEIEVKSSPKGTTFFVRFMSHIV